MAGRRRPWGLVLLVAFVLVPLAEIYVLVQIGQVVGAGWTILLLLAASVLGTVLVRREGTRAWRGLAQAVHEHRLPSRELADGALVLVGGALLLTPGFLTDAVGLACVLPGSRALLRRALTRWIAARLVIVPPPAADGVVRGRVVEDP